MISLSIVGEEAFKIYSKAVLKEELEIDSNVDELLDSLNDDFNDAKIEASGELNLDKKDENRKFKTLNLVMNSNKEKRVLQFDQNQKFRELKKVEEE